jgi:hypothetical protein
MLLVLPGGYDVIGEVDSQTDSLFWMVEPRLMRLDPAKREIQFVAFAPHLEASRAKEPMPISKGLLLTWYPPKAGIAETYMSSKAVKSLNDKGIVLPGQPGFGVK